MAWATPPNFTTGQIVTESELDILANDLAFLGGPPRARVYNSADIPIANATSVPLTFNSERYDTDTLHSTATNTGRITITTAGTYSGGANVGFASNAAGYRGVGVRLNGTTFLAYSRVPAVSGTATYICVTFDYQFAAGNYIEVVVEQTSGGVLDAVAIGNFTPEFWCHLVAVA